MSLTWKYCLMPLWILKRLLNEIIILKSYLKHNKFTNNIIKVIKPFNLKLSLLYLLLFLSDLKCTYIFSQQKSCFIINYRYFYFSVKKVIKETSNQSIIWNIHLQYPLGKFKLISYVSKKIIFFFIYLSDLFFSHLYKISGK